MYYEQIVGDLPSGWKIILHEDMKDLIIIIFLDRAPVGYIGKAEKRGRKIYWHSETDKAKYLNYWEPKDHDQLGFMWFDNWIIKSYTDLPK